MIFVLLFGVCCVCVVYHGILWRHKRRRLLELASLTPTLKNCLPVVGNALVLYGDSERLVIFYGPVTGLKKVSALKCVYENAHREPIGLLLFMNKTVNVTDLWESFKNVMQETTAAGGVLAIWLGPSLHYMITDPDDAAIILNTCLEKNRYIYDMGTCFLGGSLINTGVSRWKRNRKLLNPSFSKPLLDRFQSVFNEESKKLVKSLEPLAGKGVTKILYQVSDTAIQTVSATVLGISETNESLIDQKYKYAIKNMFSLLSRRVANVLLHPTLTFNCSPLKKIENELVGILSEQSLKVVAQRKKERAAEKDSKQEKLVGDRFQSFLDLLLDFAEDGLFKDFEIRDELSSLMSAGYDTLANVLPYTLMLLGSFPKVQEKVYEEIMSVVGPHEDVSKYHDTPYLDAVVKESMRLFPPVPVVSRDCHEELKLKNYTLPAGCHCTIGIWGIQRLPIWGPDADQFRPERWLQPDALPKSPGAYCTFSFGKRNCIGKSYSMLFCKTVLIYVVRRFSISADVSKLKLKFEIMLNPASGDGVALELRDLSVNTN